MADFSTFINSLRSEENYGFKFETFVAWFLTNDPYWKSQIKDLWKWNDYPDKWGADCGIDLVFVDYEGFTWAVQAKCYDPKYQISKSDVDKFLSESNRATIHKRLLISSTDRMGKNARQVCEAQEKSVVRFLLSDFENSAIEYPSQFNQIESKSADYKKTKSPKPHQVEAVEAVVKGFDLNDRGQLIMACGTGKTLTTLWIKEKLKSADTLVLVPSLSLLSQTLHEWVESAEEPMDSLCVCSDSTVANSIKDSSLTSTFDLGFPVTSSPIEIRNFLSRKTTRTKVIFCTYQSSSLIAEAQKLISDHSFDLAIADEAHRCAGKASLEFGLILDEEKIHSHKRLFTTATPKIYSSRVQSIASYHDVEIIGMDNEEQFGVVFYALNFGEAIDRELLTDYKVVVIGVTEESVLKAIDSRRLVEINNVYNGDFESISLQVALLKAVEKYDLRGVITFHNRVSTAKNFSASLPDIAKSLNLLSKSRKGIKADYVSGAMSSDQRRNKLNTLKKPSKNEVRLLSNARCLSEGVDVPTLDGICFADPRSSSVDIIQAVGRAIRLSEDKSLGYIVLPIFVDANGTVVDPKGYSHVWKVINALKSHDERLHDIFEKLRFNLGKRRSISSFDDLVTDKMVLDLPEELDASFIESFKLLMIEENTEVWSETIGRLSRFKDENGHLRVPYYFEESDGYRLGQRVVNIRRTKETIDADKKQQLKDLGFIWNELDQKYLDFLCALEAYKKREGNLKVHFQHQESGFALGKTVLRYRSLYKQKKLVASQIEELEELGFIWDPAEYDWNTAYEAIVEYKEKTGKINPPRSLQINGIFIGKWIERQRSQFQKLTEIQKKKLTDIGFVEVSQYELAWNQGFEHLKHYKLKHGHCNVPQRDLHEEFKLGVWCANQRRQYITGKLSEHRINSLLSIGFEWKPNDNSFDQWLSLLVHYKNEHGDLNIPKRFKMNGKNLGEWCSRIRTQFKSDELSNDKISALNKLNFDWKK